MKEKKIEYLEVLRIIACFMVIVNHTAGGLFKDRAPSLTWFGGLFYFFSSKPAVPLFLMISGTVLLGKNDTYKKTLDRILKIVIVLFVFSFLYKFVFFNQLTYSLNGFIEFLTEFINKNATNAFWYMYLYIGILLMLPILQKMVKNFNKNDYMYLMLITIVFLGTLPIITHFFTNIKVSGHIIDPLFSVYIGLFISGYFIDRYVEPNKKLVIISFMCIIFWLCF